MLMESLIRFSFKSKGSKPEQVLRSRSPRPFNDSFYSPSTESMWGLWSQSEAGSCKRYAKGEGESMTISVREFTPSCFALVSVDSLSAEHRHRSS